MKSSGVEDFRFHDLRDSCASYLAMAGATIREIQDILGHKNPAERYADAASMRAALERVAERLRRQMKLPGGTTERGDWGSARRDRDNQLAHHEEARRSGRRPALLLALAAVMLLISAFCALTLAMNRLAGGDTDTTPTSTLSYDPTYEAMAATATVLEQTPTVTTGPHTPTPTPRPPLPTRTPTPRPPTVTVGPGTPTPTPYPTDTPAPTPTATETPTETPTEKRQRTRQRTRQLRHRPRL